MYEQVFLVYFIICFLLLEGLEMPLLFYYIQYITLIFLVCFLRDLPL